MDVSGQKLTEYGKHKDTPKESPTDKCRKSDFLHNLKQHRQSRVFPDQRTAIQNKLDKIRVDCAIIDHAPKYASMIFGLFNNSAPGPAIAILPFSITYAKCAICSA